jgi:uncharacterized protein Yka (UPF0111/DUF47 family)
MTKKEKEEFDILKNKLNCIKDRILKTIYSRGKNYYYVDKYSLYSIIKEIEEIVK